MFNSKKSNKKKRTSPSPTNCVNSIPFKDIYENGIIEVEDGKFSKTYALPSVNFKSVSDEKQWQIAEHYSHMLSALGSDVCIEITLINKTIDINEFQEEVFIKMRPDGLNEYREEYNQMLVEKMLGAKNNLETKPYLTVTIDAENIMVAMEKLATIDKIVDEYVALMAQKATTHLGLIERLELLNYIYNQDNTMPLYQKRTIHVNGEEKEVESFTIESCIHQGITPKDLIAPSCLDVTGGYIKIGENYAKCYSITNFPTWIKGTVLTDFASISTNMVTSVYFDPISQEESIKMIKDQNRNIATKLLDTQKKAAGAGFDPSLVSPDTQAAKKEAEELLDEVRKDNSSLFSATFVITLFSNDLNSLKLYEDELKSICVRNLLHLKPMSMQQEQAFNSSLPIGKNYLKISRLVTSGTVASIIPFDVKNIKQKDGMYAGQHGITRSMLLVNKLSVLNPNSAILGMPGAGKSFAAKREMINVLLNTDDEVYVLDPEREYLKLVEEFHGSSIKIINGSTNYINMFDLNLENCDEKQDPVKVKINFITAILDIMIGGKYGLSPIEETIIDRCTQEIYTSYVDYLKKRNLTYAPEICPTLEDFYECLNEQPQLEAANLALALEKYVKGSADIFAHRTSVEIDNRFTVYDIKDIGGLKEVGLQICLDNVFNKMIENRAKGKRTWLYIDEFYLLMANKSSADYIAEIWKRARKWNGIPCAITQNVEDMLKNEQARTVINNCSFVTMLGQSPMNKMQLASMYDISSVEQKYISAAKPGMGLLKIQDSLIPFNDDFPKNTKLYKIMSTKPDEVF